MVGLGVEMVGFRDQGGGDGRFRDQGVEMVGLEIRGWK